MAQIGSIYVFVPNTIIRSAYVNQNFSDIRTTYNAHDVATGDVHGITAPSKIMGTGEAQSITGAKTFAAGTLKVGGAGAGVNTVQNANTANNQTSTIPYLGATATFVMTSSGSGSAATAIAVTDDTTTAATMYPVWVTATSGDLPAYVSSTKLSFNPSTGILTATGFSGPLSGNATTASNLANGTYNYSSGSIIVDCRNASNLANGTYDYSSGSIIVDARNSLTCSDANLTYDDVAESISQVWDFTVGAQLDQIRIADNDIYERDTDSDAGRLRFNYYSYNGGDTRQRNTCFYDGHGSLIFDINRADSLLGTIGGTVVSIRSPDLYGDEVGKQSFFFTGVTLFASPASNAKNSDGENLKADAHVTTRSLSKGWVSFKLTDADPPVLDTIYKSYNLPSTNPITVSATYEITINWANDFADANYVVVANCYAGEYQSGDAPNYCDGDDVQIVEKTTGYVKIVIRDNNDEVDWESTRNARIDLVAYGDLA